MLQDCIVYYDAVCIGRAMLQCLAPFLCIHLMHQNKEIQHLLHLFSQLWAKNRTEIPYIAKRDTPFAF